MSCSDIIFPTWIIVIVIIWGVLYFVGCILWFCHPCQHQSHGGSYSSAVNLPSYPCPLTHELDHLWTYYSCTLFDGCGYSQPSRGGNCLAPPSTAVALCTWVSTSIWLFWSWYWVRGGTGTGECVLCCFNSHLLVIYWANILLGKFELKCWLCIMTLSCNLFCIWKKLPDTNWYWIWYYSFFKKRNLFSPWWRACVSDKLRLTSRAACL